jgi:AcrR family transcriptional regulator
MPPQTRDQVLDAFLACVARFGMTKTTLDDVAREAGCARATVYRYFPNKQVLAAAAVTREADALGAAVVAATADAATLSDAVVTVIETGSRQLLESAALTTVVTIEPEIVLPFITFDAGAVLGEAAARRIVPAFTPFLAPDDALRLAEWVVRIGMSYLCTPDDGEIFDTARVRSLVEEFILPGFTRPVTNTEGVVPA